MEKLREHERESSTKSSAGSNPGLPVGGRHRFTRAAQTVSLISKMKQKDGDPIRQTSSVLNADNRKFLENQSSKSPEVSLLALPRELTSEIKCRGYFRCASDASFDYRCLVFFKVPRRKMILGQRSFTLDNKGDIIEYEPTPDPVPETEHAEEEAPNQDKPPPPRPLEHKDSTISSATSLSLTSADSDSDSDSDVLTHQRYVRSQSYHPSEQRTTGPLPNIDENLATENRRKSLPLVEFPETDGVRKRNIEAVSPARKAFKQWQRTESANDESPVATPEITHSITGSSSSVSSLSSSEAFHGNAAHVTHATHATQRRRGSLKRQQNVVEEDDCLPPEVAEDREEVRSSHCL